MDQLPSAYATTDVPPRAGWTRRFSDSLDRLRDAADLYRHIGFDVLIGPATPDPDLICDACPLEARIAGGTLYTRPRPIEEN